MTDEPRYFIAPDGEDEPTLWDRTPDPWNDTEPLALVRRCDVRPETWALITADPVLAAVNPDYTAAPTTAADPGAAWCPECRTRRPITDAFTSGHQERRGEVQYGVTLLDCGHHLQGPASVISAAPGAPYAGDTVTAATHHAGDLLDATKRQQIRDMIQDGQL